MIPVLTDPRAVVFHGDSLNLAQVLPENSVDSVVCDPPYELGFMGKGWDASGIAYNVDLWRQVLRVLKPGGYLVAFGGTRTYHRMACAIEDAGFEIRDSLHWMYGSGFPKSKAVDKAIDARLGAERPVVGDNPNHRAASGVDYEGVYAGGNTGATKVTGPGSPEAAAWEGWGTALKPAHEPIVLARKPLAGTVAANVLEHGTGGLNVDGCRIGSSKRVPGSPRTAPREGDAPGAFGFTNDAAGQGSGHDPNVGRWPANVLFTHADGCEVVGERREPVEQNVAPAGERHGEDWGTRKMATAAAEVVTEVYRCAEGCPVAELDRQSGTSKSRKGKPRGAAPGAGWGMTATGAEYDDLGGASRYFYCAKPSRAEREAGLDHLPVRSGGELTDREDGSAGLDNPRAGAGRRGGRRNHHPTVKPLGVMRWLARLVTPPGGTVLDPFAGSGTTGAAALAEGFEFIGIELTEEYLPVLLGRLNWALKGGLK